MNLIKKIKFIFFIIFGIMLSMAFQNCGKVDIKSTDAAMVHNLKSGESGLCLPEDYTLDTFFVTNLNVKSTQSGLQVDTDADGLSDLEELDFGTDPQLRRTSGKILDVICASADYGVNCKNISMSCNLSENSFGLNDCDILSLNLNQNIQIGVGIDSDKDGIPDYLELRINSFPNVNDAYNDLDFDQLNTMTEAERSTSVRNSNVASSALDSIQVIKTKLQNSSCAGEYWKIQILNLPTLPVDSYSDTSINSLINFSHLKDENLVMYFLKIKPTNSQSLHGKTFSGLQKIKYDYTNTDKSLEFDQSLLLFTGDVEQ